MNRNEVYRANVLKTYGADEDNIEQLLEYNRNVFEHDPEIGNGEFPLEDEGFVAAWREYEKAANEGDSLSTLKKALVQLNFPIREGISEDPRYRAVVFRGETIESCEIATGLRLNHPGRVRFWLHQTAGGRIPVLLAADRPDFESILRALTARNEPIEIPTSLGAMIVSGYNNWDRIAQYKESWLKRNPSGSWAAEFKKLVPRKNAYQDKFIILSPGPYSGVDAGSLGLSPDQWKAISLDIRLNHEGAHYWTKRACRSMRNNLHDELIADYVGIVSATGRYRADWFLRFVGLENYPVYRSGGRLEYYRGQPPLSDSAFRVLQVVVKFAAEQLEKFDRNFSGPRTPSALGRIMLALTRLTLEELGASDGASRLEHLVSDCAKQ